MPLDSLRSAPHCGRTFARLALVLVLLLVAGARAEQADFNARLGDEYERTIAVGDVHRYLIPVVAGTTLRAKLEAEAAESETGDVGKDSPGPAPTLSIVSPGGTDLKTLAALDGELRVISMESGAYAVELRAGSFVGKYSLELRGSLPDDLDAGETTVTDAPLGVLIAAPLGTSVRIEVKRKSGGPPRVVRVLDGLGRDVGFQVKRSTGERVKLHPIPVTAPNGLTVEIESTEPGGGVYEVRARAENDDDESPDDADDDREERRIVVQLAVGTDLNALALALEDQFDWELKDVRDGFAVFETPDGREGFEDEDARAAAAAFPEILVAEPDARAQIPEGTQSNGVALGSSLGRAAFDQQVALGAVSANRVRGRSSGAGVVVAVLDSGLDASHPLFAGRALAGWDFVDDDDSPAEEFDGLDNDLDGVTDEGFGHGTFVAGLVLAAAPDVTILPVRVLDTEGRGTSSDIAAGVQFAIEQGADIINFSLGTRARSEVLQGAVRLALSHGVVVVASTGNAGSTVRIDFPAGVDGVLAVSALDAVRRRAPFANGSARTSVSAPGVDLIGPYPGDRWGTWSGTSFAAALVSGGAALLRERHPTWRLAKFTRVLRRRSRGLGRSVPLAERRLLGGMLHLGKLAR